MATKSRGKNYSDANLTYLLDRVEDILPKGIDEWNGIAFSYNAHFGNGENRNGESLRNKFKELRNSSKPTGDPDCPEPVRRAKRIQRQIELSMDVVDFGDTFGNNGNEEAIEMNNASTLTSTVAVTSEIVDGVPVNPVLNRSVNCTSALASSTTANSTLASASSSTSASSRQSAASARTGMTVDELRELSRRSSITTPLSTSASSETSNKRKRIDSLLNRAEIELSPDQSDSNFMSQYFMLQAEERKFQREMEERKDRREESRREELERREEARRREELEFRRDEAERRRQQEQQFMMFMSKKN